MTQLRRALQENSSCAARTVLAALHASKRGRAAAGELWFRQLRMASSPAPSPDFPQWLRQGRGLAVLRASEATGLTHRDAVLDACTHFTGYDFQVEASRAEYLFDVLVATGLRDALEEPILRALEEREDWDRAQLMDLAVLFAFDGSRAAEQAIQDTFVRCAGELERPGAEQLVRARGLAGLAFAARELGRVLPDSGADWPEVHPLEIAEAQFGAEAVADTLATAAAREPLVGRFWDAVKAYRKQMSERRPRPQTPLPFPLTFDGLRSAVLAADRPPAKMNAKMTFRRWGREASAPELTRAAEALTDDLPSALRKAILRAFAARTFPGPPEVLLGALDGGDAETIEAAWRALRWMKSPKVRARAIQELSMPSRRLEALQGLERNFQGEDVPLVASVLANAVDDAELHFIGLSILDTAVSCGERYLLPLLQALYERGVCSTCRHSIVKWMHALGGAPRTILDECRRDASLELRADAALWSR